jgi:hypothetical protein
MGRVGWEYVRGRCAVGDISFRTAGSRLALVVRLRTRQPTPFSEALFRDLRRPGTPAQRAKSRGDVPPGRLWCSASVKLGAGLDEGAATLKMALGGFTALAFAGCRAAASLPAVLPANKGGPQLLLHSTISAAVVAGDVGTQDLATMPVPRTNLAAKSLCGGAGSASFVSAGGGDCARDQGASNRGECADEYTHAQGGADGKASEEAPDCPQADGTGKDDSGNEPRARAAAARSME